MLFIMPSFESLSPRGGARRAFGRSLKLAGRAAFVVALGLGSMHAEGGCSGTVKDPGDAKAAFECTSDPVLFCAPLPPGSVGCTGAPDSADVFLKKLPADKTYAEGCYANFVRRDPKIEDVCGLAAVCTCLRVEDPVDSAAPRPQDAAIADTSVPPPPDAEADAGDPDAGPQDAEADTAPTVDAASPPDAAPPTPVPPPAARRLVWNCR